MKIIRNSFILLLSVIFLFVLVRNFFQYIENPSSHWDHPEEIPPSYFNRGWLPQWLPENATNIYQQHNIDTNQIWVKFEVKRDMTLPKDFTKLNDKHISKLKIPEPYSAFWWFEGLIQQQPANDNALSANIFQKEENNLTTYLIIDRTSAIYYLFSERKNIQDEASFETR